MNVAAPGQKITRFSIYLLIAATLCLPRLASADPVTVAAVPITGGALVSNAEGAAQLIIAGEGGFGLAGTGSFQFFLPFAQCVNANDCQPGGSLGLGGHWDGSDLNGVMTYGGEIHPVGTPTDENATTVFNFFGSATLPAFDGTTLTSQVSAPFTFSGQVLFPPDLVRTLDLTGQGLATIRLRWSATDSERGWRFDGANYMFNTAAAVPEPGTMVLVGLGLAGLAARRRRRRESAQV